MVDDKHVVLKKTIKGCPKKRKYCTGCPDYEDHERYCACNSLEWPEPKEGYRKWKKPFKRES